MMKQALTVDRLKSVLSYDLTTGNFIWKICPRGKGKVGAVAGTISRGGYRRIILDQKAYLAHRLAWFYVHGVWPDGGLDHKDRDTLNNRIDNLRPCNQAQNLQNTSPVGTGASKYRGVWRNRREQKWVAEIMIGGKKRHLGQYADEEDAARAYQSAKRELHPFYAELAA